MPQILAKCEDSEIFQAAEEIYGSAEDTYMKFENLLDSLAILVGIEDQDDLIDKAYSIALETSFSEEHLRLMVEALHKKWLSDENFASVAVKLCLRLADVEIEDDGIKFRSLVFCTLFNDYKDRHGMRKINRPMFANGVHFAFQYFRHFYTGAEECPCNSLIEPMFDYLAMLIDETASVLEATMFHRLMFLLGEKMDWLDHVRMSELMLAARRLLITCEDFEAMHRALIMEILEIYNHGWNIEKIPGHVQKMYETYRPKHYQLVRYNETFIDSLYWASIGIE